MKKTVAGLLASVLALGPAWPADACTGISFTTQDKSFLQARTIEWGGFSLDSKLVILPRGQKNRKNNQCLVKDAIKILKDAH